MALRMKMRLRESERFKTVFINDDMTKAERERRRALLPIAKRMREQKIPHQLRRDQLYHDGRPISSQEAEVMLNLVDVPRSLRSGPALGQDAAKSGATAMEVNPPLLRSE